jgi:CBS-domain-containing membrane protein
MTASHPLPSLTTARDLMKEMPLVIPSRMSVGAAASLMDAVGASVAPVTDSRGRCVGLLGAADCRQWLDRGSPRGEVVSEWQTIPPASVRDEVGHHMTRRFAVASLEAGVHELAHRLNGVGNPYLVVLDRQRRPRGIVCALDVVAAVAGDVEADGESAPDGRRPAW